MRNNCNLNLKSQKPLESLKANSTPKKPLELRNYFLVLLELHRDRKLVQTGMSANFLEDLSTGHNRAAIN